MCTYKITIDDALLERVRPAFADNEEIGSWMQSQIEMILGQLAQDMPAVEKDLTVEEEYEMVCKEVKGIYGRE